MTTGDRRPLDEVRSRLPTRALAADVERIIVEGRGLVVDTRPAVLRHRDGELSGAIVLERNVLEWRLDPTSPHRLAEVTDHDQEGGGGVRRGLRLLARRSQPPGTRIAARHRPRGRVPGMAPPPRRRR